MSGKTGKPDFHIIVICNLCDKRYDMFPKGDQSDQVVCKCGREVSSSFSIIHGKMAHKKSSKKLG